MQSKGWGAREKWVRSRGRENGLNCSTEPGVYTHRNTLQRVSTLEDETTALRLTRGAAITARNHSTCFRASLESEAVRSPSPTVCRVEHARRPETLAREEASWRA